MLRKSGEIEKVAREEVQEEITAILKRSRDQIHVPIKPQKIKTQKHVQEINRKSSRNTSDFGRRERERERGFERERERE